MFSKREIVHEKLRLLALVVFALSLPFSMLINNLAIMLLIVNWFFESTLNEKWNRIKQNRLVVFFLLFYLLHVFWLICAENMKEGLFELEKKLTLFLAPLILATSNTIFKKDFRTIFKAFVLSCTIASLICFCYAGYRNYEEGHTLSYIFNAVFFDIHLPGRYYYFNYWYFTYKIFASAINIHPVYFSMYIVFSSCLAIWLWWDKSGSKKNINNWVILFLVYNFIVVILLSSRTQLLSMLLLGTGFIIYYSYFRKKLIKGLLFVFFIYGFGFMLIYLNPVSRERFIESNLPGRNYSDNKYGEGGFSLRKYKWKYTLETIMQSPVLGTGTGDSQDELQLTYKKNNFEIGYINNFNSHNQFLQSALELGLLGLCSFLLCLFLPAYYALKKHAWLYLVFIALFSLSCITESMLEVNKGIVFYSVFNSLFAFHFLKEI